MGISLIFMMLILMLSWLFQDIFVVLGERHLLKAEQGQTNFYVTDMQIHLNFNPKHNIIENNLAVLKLHSLPDSKYRPACLPPTGNYRVFIFISEYKDVYKNTIQDNLKYTCIQVVVHFKHLQKKLNKSFLFYYYFLIINKK